jgi:hypothetical protein
MNGFANSPIHLSSYVPLTQQHQPIDGVPLVGLSQHGMFPLSNLEQIGHWAAGSIRVACLAYSAALVVLSVKELVWSSPKADRSSEPVPTTGDKVSKLLGNSVLLTADILSLCAWSNRDVTAVLCRDIDQWDVTKMVVILTTAGPVEAIVTGVVISTIKAMNAYCHLFECIVYSYQVWRLLSGPGSLKDRNLSVNNGDRSSQASSKSFAEYIKGLYFTSRSIDAALRIAQNLSWKRSYIDTSCRVSQGLVCATAVLAFTSGFYHWQAQKNLSPSEK